MLRRIALWFFVICGCLLFGFVILVVGMTMLTASASLGGTLPTGRSVTAKADSWYIGSEFTGDTAIIRTFGHRIVVAPTQLSVDGTMYAPILNTVKSVDVTLRDGEVSFTADGEPVAPFRR